jgi:Ca2+-transporting ATPase
MKLKDVVAFFIDSVTIIVVAVPEGLPLAVTIALAYSVKKMQKDKNLVRVMAACETMGGCTNICSDKTGTLTQNVMTVVDGYFAGWACEGELPAPAGKGCGLSAPALKIISESVAANTKAEIGFDAKKGKPNEIIGNKTEGALLLLLQSLGCQYRELRDKVPIIKSFPFSSTKKRMSTIVQVDDGEGVKRRIYTKGASEVVLQLCSTYMDQDGSIKQLTPELRARVLQYISKMASQGLRTLTLTFKDLGEKQGAAVSGEVGAEGSAAVDQLASLEKDMTLLAAFGIKDPLRKEVPEAVRKCQRAGITVRMLTGDSLLTAKNIAKECGILTRDGTALEGPDFRKLSTQEKKERLRVKTLPNGQVQTLQVMARCSPQDKLELVRCLKELGEVVAVTGDGTNDAPALKEADVGLSMGIAGTAVAQEASDIVIMDDNFSSIVQSVMWGRSVYDNIRRFLQFQLTVNVVALTICLVGAVVNLPLSFCPSVSPPAPRRSAILVVPLQAPLRAKVARP